MKLLPTLQLVDANKQWQDFYESNREKINEFESKIHRQQQEIETMKTQDEQKRSDFERIINESKQHCSDEEVTMYLCSILFFQTIIY